MTQPMYKSDSPKLSILIVEDDDSYREVITKGLKTSGFETFDAKDGQQAISICEIMHIDSVITDIFMPVMDGVDLSKRLKESHPQIKVYFTSSVYPPKALEAEIPKNRFIQKNHNFREFLKQFVQLLEKKPDVLSPDSYSSKL